MEEENELMFMRMRYYDPLVGRFIKPDPLENFIEYSYVYNNPIVLIDPLGLWYITLGGSVSLIGKIGIGISVGSEGLYFHVSPGIGTPNAGASLMYSPANPKIGWSEPVGEVSTPWIVTGKIEVAPKREEESWWEYTKEYGQIGGGIGLIPGGAAVTKTRTWQLFKWPWAEGEKKKRDLE